MSDADRGELLADPRGEAEEAQTQAARWDWGLVALLCGLLSAVWAVLILIPDAIDLPAWPAASIAIFALLFARMPGRALLRGLATFFAALGLLVGLGKILALWGLLELLG